MKKLIEKIKSYSFYDFECLEDFYKAERLKQTILYDLKKIQEQESKEFNPCECGLIFDDDENAEHDGWFITKQYENKKILRTVLTHVFDNKYSLHVQAFRNNQWVFQFYVINIITIPNHRQGVELLRNLGVIDAD